jgi:hypothetical protein
MDLEANIFLYKYTCSRWYGYHTGLKNLIVHSDTTDEEVINMAQSKANLDSGSKSCDIFLLQKFNAVIKPSQSYSDLASIPFDTGNGLTKLISKNKVDISSDTK